MTSILAHKNNWVKTVLNYVEVPCLVNVSVEEIDVISLRNFVRNEFEDYSWRTQ